MRHNFGDIGYRLSSVMHIFSTKSDNDNNEQAKLKQSHSDVRKRSRCTKEYVHVYVDMLQPKIEAKGNRRWRRTEEKIARKKSFGDNVNGNVYHLRRTNSDANDKEKEENRIH